MLWYKGNLHTHTSGVGSDGPASPENVVRWYTDHGYDFLAITDHNVFSPVESDDLVMVRGVDSQPCADRIGSSLRLLKRPRSAKAGVHPVLPPRQISSSGYNLTRICGQRHSVDESAIRAALTFRPYVNQRPTLRVLTDYGVEAGDSGNRWISNDIARSISPNG